MSNQYLKLRRSNVPGKIPTTESIDFGEIALNTYDGLAYMKINGPNGIEVIPVGVSSGSFTGDFIGTFTGSLQGTASWAENYNETDPVFTAVSGTFITTSSFNSFTSSYKNDSSSFDSRIATNSSSIASISSSFSSFSSSYNTGSFSGSFVGNLNGTSSWATNALTASFAPAYLPLTGGTINGNVILNGTASIAFLNVTIQSSSVIYSSGSNVFGDSTQDTQTLVGTVLVSGSQSITGSLIVTQGITGSLLGTSSWAFNAITASFVTSSNVYGPFGSNSILSASYAVSSSQTVTASFASTASYLINAKEFYYTGSAPSGSFITTGSLWIDSDTGYMFAYIDDGSDRVWIQPTVEGEQGPIGLTGPQGPVGPQGPTGSSQPFSFVGNDMWATTSSLQVTGSLTVSGSGTFTNIGPAVFSGSIIVLEGITGSLLGTSSWATSASYYAETDPVFVAKSASLATTGSNVFIGNQTVTGSLFTSGSNTLLGNTVLTGSLNITGSTTQIGNNTLIGNTTLSGSIQVSGSQTFNGSSSFYGTHELSGSNTIRGNTFMFGNIQVSGSSNFNNSEFIVTGSTSILGNLNVKGTSVFSNTTFTITGSQYFTGSSFINGNQSLTGNSTVTGSLNVLGNINVVSGSSFTRWGNKLFNYGVFSDTTTQTGPQNTILSMSFNTTDIGGAGVSVVNNTKITVDNTGIYNLQFSAQFDRTTSGTNTATIWFAYTGSSIPNSATDVLISGNAANNPVVASWNYVLPMSASSYVEIYWSHDDNEADKVELKAVPARTGPIRPAVPSVIATLTQIA